MQGWVTTGEASENLKKTSVRDLFVCHVEPGKAVKRCRSSSRLQRYGHSKCHWRRCENWGLGANIRRLLSRADNHRRHISGRRLHAQLSLRDLLTMAFEFLSQEMLHFLVLLVSMVFKCYISWSYLSAGNVTFPGLTCQQEMLHFLVLLCQREMLHFLVLLVSRKCYISGLTCQQEMLHFTRPKKSK